MTCGITENYEISLSQRRRGSMVKPWTKIEKATMTKAVVMISSR
jgi:hypothetical protein